MLFNSLSFAIFLPLVFVVYWLIGGKCLHLQNNIFASLWGAVDPDLGGNGSSPLHG